jgi:hypothetical protein
VRGFGRHLRALYYASDYDRQRDLADAAGYNRTGGLQHVLDGRALPERDRLLGLARALGCSVADLWDYPEARAVHEARRG